MPRPRVDPRWAALVVAALVVGGASVAVSPSLGYDSWGWMTWGRELRHGTLDTLSGPSWKPGPSLVAAVISVFTSRQEPGVWLAIVRAAALVSLAVTFVATRDLAAWTIAGRSPRDLGPAAWGRGAPGDGAPANGVQGDQGVATAAGKRAAAWASTFGAIVATLLVATSADLVKTAMYGSSEPFLVLGAVTALLLHVRGRPLGVVLALALTGLTRPEAWVICGLYALTLLPHGTLRTRAAAIAGTLVAPVVWLWLDWIGSGNLSQSADTAEHLTAGSAARAAFPAGEVFLRGSGTLILPGLVLVVGAVVWAAWRRDRLLLALTGASLLWTSMIAVQAELGLSGDRRYQAGCAAIMSVVAGVGVARGLRWLAGRGHEAPAPDAATSAAGGT
ncbi:MAG: hypothetical protein REI11_22180, partial [Patulibacter sp.]|nr:hypothetical protein [Patulibacter sp.]